MNQKTFCLVFIIILLIILLVIVKYNIFENFNVCSTEEEEQETKLIQSDKQELVKILNSVMDENNDLKQKIHDLLSQTKKNSNQLHVCNKVRSLSDYQASYGERKNIIDNLKSKIFELIEDNKDLDDQNNDIISVHRNKQLSKSAQYGSTLPTPFV